MYKQSLKSGTVRIYTKLINLLQSLPYFPGKGLIAILFLQITKNPLPIRLPNLDYILVTSDDPYWVASLWLGKYQPSFTRTFWRILNKLPAGTGVIDVGAHIGYYSLIAASYLSKTAGKVFGFEPNPLVFSWLWRNKEINNFSNLKVLNKAVSNVSKKDYLFVGSHTGYSSLRKSSRHSQAYEVECITIDEFIRFESNAKIKLIKIDAEGAELLILQGAQETIVHNKPYIMYEENEEACADFGYSTRDIRIFLKDLHYEIYNIDKISHYSNCLAIPNN